MISRFRVLEMKNPHTGEWEESGAVYERTFDSPDLYAIPVAGAGDVKVNWRDWEDFKKREREYGLFGPPLEEYAKVFVDHADRYRLSTEVYTVEGDTYKEIRDRLYQRYVLDPMRAREERQRIEALTYESPADRPLAKVRVVKESKTQKEKEDDCNNSGRPRSGQDHARGD